MKNKIIIITAVVALLIVGVAFGFNIAARPDQYEDRLEPISPTPAETQIPDKDIDIPPYYSYLENFLQDTGYRHLQTVKNDFTYYELYADDDKLAGFVLPGIGEGWGGQIFMFIKTDVEGIIKQVHVWQHSETPIYVVDLEGFLSTFAGFKAGEELLWQTDIHGLTGATLTAEAVIAAVHDIGQKAHEKGIFIE
jgi:hypothetical protein